MGKLTVTSVTKALVALHNFSSGCRAEGVFYRSLLDQIGVYESEEQPHLAWVEKDKACVNPEMFGQLSLAEQVGLLAHEARHLYQGTIRRSKLVNNVDPLLYNVASDLTINESLMATGFTLPQGVITLKSFAEQQPDVYKVLQKKFVVHETTEEQVYKILVDAAAEVPKGFEGDLVDGGEGNTQQGEGQQSQPQVGTVESSMKIKVASALVASKKFGDLPGHLAAEIDGVLKEHTPWPEKVRSWMQAFSDSDLSWQRPDAGLLANSLLILPDFWSETMGELVVAIDTSGSMTQEMLDAIAGHISAGLAEVKPSKLHVIYCDTRVQHVDVFDNPLTVKFKVHGGGGTCFRPPFEYLKEKKINPAGMIYFTDGYGDFPGTKPTYPVLWGVVDGGVSEVPFGDYVRIDV